MQREKKQQYDVRLANGLRLKVREWQAPVIKNPDLFTYVLIHGSGDSASVWHAVAADLPAQHRVLAVDLRGHGDSDWSTDGDYSGHTMAADVQELIDELQLSNMLLLGHSFGGEIALRCAVAKPDHVKGLVLVDYGLEANPETMGHVRKALRAAHRRYRDYKEYAEVLSARHPLATSTLLHLIAQETTCSDAEGSILKYDPAFIGDERTTPLSNTKPLWNLLAALRSPLLVMRGVASSVLTQGAAERMVRAAGVRANLEIVPASGHSIQIDNPIGFGAAMRKFVAMLPLRQEPEGPMAISNDAPSEEKCASCAEVVK